MITQSLHGSDLEPMFEQEEQGPAGQGIILFGDPRLKSSAAMRRRSFYTPLVVIPTEDNFYEPCSWPKHATMHKAVEDVGGDNASPRLADFGNTNITNNTLRFTETTKVGWTHRWTAPEMLCGQLCEEPCYQPPGNVLSVYHLNGHNWGPPLAGGARSDIWIGASSEGQKFAIKCQRHFSKDKNERHMRAVREIYTWSKCNHPNIVPLLGIAHFKGNLAMISSWMEHGDVHTYLSQNDADHWSLCHQTATGLAYLHKVGVVHGSIKGHNILISDTGVAQIGGFGVSAGWYCGTDSDTLDGDSVRWMAPELITRGTYCSPASMAGDVWALGMTILEIFTGNDPYQELESDIHVIMAITQGESPARPPKMSIATSFGEERWLLVVKCWNMQEEVRPSAQSLEYMMRLLL